MEAIGSSIRLNLFPATAATNNIDVEDAKVDELISQAIRISFRVLSCMASVS